MFFVDDVADDADDDGNDDDDADDDDDDDADDDDDDCHRRSKDVPSHCRQHRLFIVVTARNKRSDLRTTCGT